LVLNIVFALLIGLVLLTITVTQNFIPNFNFVKLMSAATSHGRDAFKRRWKTFATMQRGVKVLKTARAGRGQETKWEIPNEQDSISGGDGNGLPRFSAFRPRTSSTRGNGGQVRHPEDL
jgi:hypothetical protein